MTDHEKGLRDLCDVQRATIEQLQAKIAAMREAFVAVIEQQGIDHEDGCPEDDTCECNLPQMVNKALSPAAGNDLVKKMKRMEEGLLAINLQAKMAATGDGIYVKTEWLLSTTQQSLNPKEAK